MTLIYVSITSVFGLLSSTISKRSNGQYRETDRKLFVTLKSFKQFLQKLNLSEISVTTILQKCFSHQNIPNHNLKLQKKSKRGSPDDPLVPERDPNSSNLVTNVLVEPAGEGDAGYRVWQICANAIDFAEKLT